MSTKLQIANVTQMLLGQAAITSLDDTSDPQAVDMNSIFDARNEELQSRDWKFNRTRVQLTRVYEMELDAAPSPAAFVLGSTVTGGTSGVTCVVKAVISSTKYWVTAPSGDFAAAGETLSDGTSSRACAAGYPTIETEPIAFGSWKYCYAMPTDCLNPLGVIDQYYDKVRYPHAFEGNFVFSNQKTCYFHYNRYISDVSEITRGWYTNLLAADMANLLVSKFIGSDQYMGLRLSKGLQQAWLDALSANGREAYYENPLGESTGSTKSYIGMRHLPGSYP